jgi:hypothetical protein
MGLAVSLFQNKTKERKSCEHQLQSPTDVESSDIQVLQSTETPSAQTDEKGRCVICRQEQIAARKYRWRLIIGLFFPFALQALDVTIVASALPWIASDFSTCPLVPFRAPN